jgi:hypothetical protein
LGIKLEVIQLKHRNIKNIKIIRAIIKNIEYDVKISHVMFRVFQCCVNNCGKPHYWASQCECYYARGCAVVTYFGYYFYGLLQSVNIHAVYFLGIGCKIYEYLSLIYLCVSFYTGIVYVVAWFSVDCVGTEHTEVNAYIH